LKEVVVGGRLWGMELTDVWRRIVGQHWRLIGACVLVGLVVVALLVSRSPVYMASARLILDVPDPQTNAETAGIADTVSAIAASPSEVAAAMRTAGVRNRDPAAVGRNSVSVASLGQSAVLNLSVSDRDPRVAAALANALAAQVIRTRLAVTRGQASEVTAQLNQRIARVNRQIADLQVGVDRLTIQVAAARSPGDANLLRARQNEAVRQLDLLDQTRSSLESQRVSLLSTSALQRDPQIISPATPPLTRASSGFVPDLVLGAFVGLVIGVGIAGLIETVRPKLIGSDAVAREFDAPLLGRLSTVPAEASEAELGPLALRVRLAGKAAGLPNLRVVPVREGTDLAGFARWLDDRGVSGDDASVDPSPSRSAPEYVLAGGASSGALAPDALPYGIGDAPPYQIRQFDPESALRNGSHMGLVLVSPDRLARSELETVRHLLRVSPGSLLGVVTYRQSRRVGVRGSRRRSRGSKRSSNGG
jgi:capsular polysaccharide biosynthesis protein